MKAQKNIQSLTTTDQKELLNTQNFGEEIPKGTSLVTRDPIENTPFWLINNKDGWFITFGEYRVGDIQTTKDEALNQLKEKQWDIVMHVAAVIVEKTLQERERIES